METVPAVAPVTAPVAEPTDALLFPATHAPPAVLLLNEVVALTQTDAIPVTDAGIGLTVTVADAIQPEGNV